MGCERDYSIPLIWWSDRSNWFGSEQEIYGSMIVLCRTRDRNLMFDMVNRRIDSNSVFLVITVGSQLQWLQLHTDNPNGWWYFDPSLTLCTSMRHASIASTLYALYTIQFAQMKDIPNVNTTADYTNRWEAWFACASSTHYNMVLNPAGLWPTSSKHTCSTLPISSKHKNMYLHIISPYEHCLLDHLSKQPLTFLGGEDQCAWCIWVNKDDCVLDLTLQNCAVILDEHTLPETACYCCQWGKHPGCWFVRRAA